MHTFAGAIVSMPHKTALTGLVDELTGDARLAGAVNVIARRADGRGGRMKTAVKIKVRPLTAARWRDLETLFNASGCAVARSCWCMYFRRSGEPARPPGGVTRSHANRADLLALVDAGETPGLIAYRGKTPVGWVSLGPRDDYPKLARSPVMKPVDAQPVWSVVCFVVPRQHRGGGVARALLDGAIAYAKKCGARLLEGYPVDRQGRSKDDVMWFGAKSMYDAAGFDEVARRRPHRPIVRIQTR